MKIRLLNMGFTYTDGAYVKPNIDIKVTIEQDNSLTVVTSQETVTGVSLSALEEYLLDNYGDEL